MSLITPSEVINSHIQGMLSQLYTSMPAKVIAVKKEDSTTIVDVQPMLNMRFKDGSVIQEPPLGDVPIMWPSAGGCFLTMPIEVGDEVMLHFSMRSSAEYKNSDGVEPQTAVSKRLHNMNDAYATPCTTTYKKGREVDSTSLELSSGATEIKVKKDGTIELGKDAVEALILGNEFLTKFLSHTHTYVDTVGATATPKLTVGVTTALSVPDTPTLWENILSKISFTK